ncbi:hypothetical protein imdm_2021 [gamma proteobacterium IMCC2047]|nr:hypothetical protein imdm_2021 [gamma proteobacterium IMCC2047]
MCGASHAQPPQLSGWGTTDLKPIHVGGGTYSVEIPKSKARQEADIKQVVEATKSEYLARVNASEAMRQDDLKTVQDALHTAIEAEKVMQKRIESALAG